jgi:H+/Cl- antiporter ClcA
MYQNKRAAVKRARTGDAERATIFWGYVLFIFTIVSFVVFLYATIISKLLPDTNYKILIWIKYDHYYCWLIPTTIPVTYLFIYLNWMSLKFFRHN